MPRPSAGNGRRDPSTFWRGSDPKTRLILGTFRHFSIFRPPTRQVWGRKYCNFLYFRPQTWREFLRKSGIFDKKNFWLKTSKNRDFWQNAKKVQFIGYKWGSDDENDENQHFLQFCSFCEFWSSKSRHFQLFTFSEQLFWKNQKSRKMRPRPEFFKSIFYFSSKNRKFLTAFFVTFHFCQNAIDGKIGSEKCD